MSHSGIRRPCQFSIATLMLVCVIVGMGVLVLVQQLNRRARDLKWQQRLEQAREAEALTQQRRWSADIAALFLRAVLQQDYTVAHALLWETECRQATALHKESITPEKLKENIEQWLSDRDIDAWQNGRVSIVGGHGWLREDKSFVFSFELAPNKNRNVENLIYCCVQVQRAAVRDIREWPNTGFGYGFRVKQVYWKSQEEHLQDPHTLGTSILTAEPYQFTDEELKALGRVPRE